MIRENADRKQELWIYTVYDHPHDRPDMYVCLRDLITPAGPARDVSFIVGSEEISRVRQRLLGLGLTCIGRNEQDDPAILEVWI